MSIKYGHRPKYKLDYAYIRNVLTYPHLMIRSYERGALYGELAVMMVVNNEQKTIRHCIDSIKNLSPFRLIVVDKNGKTIPIIKEIQDELNFDADYYTKPNHTLKESRQFALSKLDESYMIIIDGDEVLSEHGLLAVMRNNYKNSYIRTRKNIVVPYTLTQDKTPIVNNGYHIMFFHNNGTLHFKDITNADLPFMSGRCIHMNMPILWNVHYWKNNHWRYTNMRRVLYDNVIQGNIPKQVLKARLDYFDEKNKQEF